MAIAFEHSIDLPQTPAQVFAVLDDYKKAPLWLNRCEGVAKQGTGPNKVGDKLRYAYCEAGKHGLMDGVIVAQDQDRRLAYKYYDRTMQVFAEFRLTPTDAGGTHLIHRIEITPHSFLAKLTSPLMRMKLPKQTVAAMDALKALLARENGAQA